MGQIGETMSLGGYETEWDETGHNAISLIIVTFDQYRATSIEFGYIENGSLIM